MIFDFIFSFAFLASIAKGYIKGLSKTIFNFIILIAAVIITFSLFNTIGDVFLQSKVGSNLSNEISKEVDAIICEHKDKPENMPYLSSMIKLVSNDEDYIFYLETIGNYYSPLNT